MATPIKQVPILSGEIADDFVRRAEENEGKPHAPLSPEQEERISLIMKELRENELPWMRKNG